MEHRRYGIGVAFRSFIDDSRQQLFTTAVETLLLDITAADETTAHAVMAELEQWWDTSGIMPVQREPGMPGVKARV
ncbi:DUF6207 family protein [Streptomyces atratus]|uniref:DUF6207 family protein n=1 Tax=Streptomyces atratus TaxID=1893 RepID=UPI001670C3BA|nr:DUF6207 family protein [Streptomyces atratus]WPW26659.1 DUF6207 family protein [Streptomyces atratus]GGT59403.1 hypothetical protein GCM10010207_68740 [Streptomyces atratus]